MGSKVLSVIYTWEALVTEKRSKASAIKNNQLINEKELFERLQLIRIFRDFITACKIIFILFTGKEFSFLK